MKHTLKAALAALAVALASPLHAGTPLVVAGSEAVDSLLDRMAVRFAEAVERKGGDLFDVNLIRGRIYLL